MRFLERSVEQPRNRVNTDGDPGAGDPLTDARTQAERLLALGDQAIQRVLSGNSESFLNASRQQGGE